MTKRLYVLALLIVCCLASVAQVDFKLQANGRFITEDGKDFVVVPLEGKSAHEIYTMLVSNVTSMYNDASSVMNTVEDSMVKIRGFAKSGKLFPYITMFDLSAECYYQLEFKVRDGRVRVSAPMVEDKAIFTGGDGGPSDASYSWLVQKHLFEKNGVVKKKRAKAVASVEDYINSIINSLLTESSQIEEDW